MFYLDFKKQEIKYLKKDLIEIITNDMDENFEQTKYFFKCQKGNLKYRL